MTATEVRQGIQAVVEAHGTHKTFYSIWNPAKDRDTQSTFPFVAWDQWRSRFVTDANGFLQRFVPVQLLIVTSVATDRTSAQRDAAVEAAEEAASDILLRLITVNRWEITEASCSTVYDEYTQLDTGVVLRFVVDAGAICYDAANFTS